MPELGRAFLNSQLDFQHVGNRAEHFFQEESATIWPKKDVQHLFQYAMLFKKFAVLLLVLAAKMFEDSHAHTNYLLTHSRMKEKSQGILLGVQKALGKK